MRERSLAKERADADWAARGDIINDEAVVDGARGRCPSCGATSSESRASSAATLTVVPEIRWLKNPDMLKFFLTETDGPLPGPRRRPGRDPVGGAPGPRVTAATDG